MSNNQRYFIYSLIFFTAIEMFLFTLFGWLVFELLAKLLGIGEGLELVVYAIFSFYASLFGLLLSYIVFFLTIPKIYKKLGASFSFKHPVLFTSIIIFVLGNILFYLSMLVWTLLGN